MRLRSLTACAAAVFVLASCSKGSDAPTAEEVAPKAPFSATVSPLTGLGLDAQPSNPVYYVKIENTNGGEPQYGENKADMMIEELVEDGATRLIGLFYSELPTKVGHVRSARTTDIALSQPVNATIVASGSAQKTRDDILGAKINFYTYDWDDPGWSSDPDKNPPYHVLWDITKLDAAGKPGDKPTKNYFDWGKGPEGDDVTKKVTSASVKFSPETTTRWSFSGGTWHRSPERAAPGQEFKADTVVVIFAKVVEAGYNDKAGNPVPETVVEGSGRAVILSGGDAVEATWHKAAPDATMTFTSQNGNPVSLKPGHVWMEAVPRGGSINF